MRWLQTDSRLDRRLRRAGERGQGPPFGVLEGGFLEYLKLNYVQTTHILIITFHIKSIKDVNN